MKNFLYWELKSFMESQMVWRSDYQWSMIDMTLKNFIEVRQMTLNDPKFDIKKSLDTLLSIWFSQPDLTAEEDQASGWFRPLPLV